MTPAPPRLPPGVVLHPLETHRDSRGGLTELLRRDWFPALDAAQWNAVTSRAGTLRGVHLHGVHRDYLVVLTGRMLVGLSDLRPGVPREERGSVVELVGPRAGLLIPPGVAHGFYYPEPSLHVYAMDCVWNEDDDVSIHFADPDLAIGWDVSPRYLSARDREARPLREVAPRIEALLRSSRAPSSAPATR